jgi:hypothetical protein
MSSFFHSLLVSYPSLAKCPPEGNTNMPVSGILIPRILMKHYRLSTMSRLLTTTLILCRLFSNLHLLCRSLEFSKLATTTPFADQPHSPYLSNIMQTALFPLPTLHRTSHLP